MKINELKSQMKEIRKELKVEVSKIIQFNTDKISLFNINITKGTGGGTIGIRIRCKDEADNIIRGSIRYCDKDNLSYIHSKTFLDMVPNSDDILKLVSKCIFEKEDIILNLFKEYSDIEYRLMIEIRKNIIFKKENIMNIDLCDSSDLDRVNQCYINLNCNPGYFRIMFPVKMMTEGEKYKYNEIDITIANYKINDTITAWWFGKGNKFGDIKDYMTEELKNIIETFIKEN